MKLEELKTSDVESYLKTKRAVFIPVGSVEQHGSHLPPGTDSFPVDSIVESVSRGVKNNDI